MVLFEEFLDVLHAITIPAFDTFGRVAHRNDLVRYIAQVQIKTFLDIPLLVFAHKSFGDIPRILAVILKLYHRVYSLDLRLHLPLLFHKLFFFGVSVRFWIVILIVIQKLILFSQFFVDLLEVDVGIFYGLYRISTASQSIRHVSSERTFFFKEIKVWIGPRVLRRLIELILEIVIYTFECFAVFRSVSLLYFILSSVHRSTLH